MAQTQKEIGAAISTSVTSYLEAYNEKQAYLSEAGTGNTAISAFQPELQGDVSIQVVQQYSDICTNSIATDNTKIAALDQRMIQLAPTIVAYFQESQGRTGIVIGSQKIVMSGNTISVVNLQ